MAAIGTDLYDQDDLVTIFAAMNLSLQWGTIW